MHTVDIHMYLLDICIRERLRIVNGRVAGDSLRNYICYTQRGSRVVDYLIVAADMLKCIRHFKVDELNTNSDHCLLTFSMECNLKSGMGEKLTSQVHPLAYPVQRLNYFPEGS